MKHLLRCAGFCIWFLLIGMPVHADDADIEIGIVEKLGHTIPLDLSFQNSNGDTVQLRDIITKPTILNFVYYRCPGICPRLLSSLGDMLDRLTLVPGTDYQVVTISFDPTDTPESSRNTKANYYNPLRDKMPEASWLFLTSDQPTISKITEAAGFRYKADKQDFIHASALIIVSPQGKITRYIMGLDYSPFDVKLALLEASEGRVGATINKVLLYCFSYDPEGRTYAMNVTKIAGTVILFIAFLFGLTLVISGKARQKN
ncbi:SCO family protein [candidate division KSB1 bacterium]|nr:SCO family protein [candidate division KSB1 bacterium]